MAVHIVRQVLMLNSEVYELVHRQGELGTPRQHDVKSIVQSVFMVTGGSASPAAVVRQWASESQSYDYDSNTCSGICGHYTQLVWKRTSRVGCAVAKENNREIWVCDYDPPGNVLGQLPY